jgi:hypothetical protein
MTHKTQENANVPFGATLLQFECKRRLTAATVEFAVSRTVRNNIDCGWSIHNHIDILLIWSCQNLTQLVLHKSKILGRVLHMRV